LLDAWRFAFFGGVSGAIILGLSGTLTGAASAACGAALDSTAAVVANAVAAATLTSALAVIAALAGAAVAELLAENDVADANGASADGAAAADGVGTSAGVAVATVDDGAAGGALTACGCACGIARAAVRAEALGLSAGAGAPAAIGTEPVAALMAIAGELTVAVLTVGVADGTAVSRTLVTMARAAIGVFCASAGRSTSDRTTPAPAVAPIAVATRTTRAVRAKLGAGAK
jgi:hypothetical protein